MVDVTNPTNLQDATAPIRGNNMGNQKAAPALDLTVRNLRLVAVVDHEWMTFREYHLQKSATSPEYAFRAHALETYTLSRQSPHSTLFRVALRIVVAGSRATVELDCVTEPEQNILFDALLEFLDAAASYVAEKRTVQPVMRFD